MIPVALPLQSKKQIVHVSVSVIEAAGFKQQTLFTHSPLTTQREVHTHTPVDTPPTNTHTHTDTSADLITAGRGEPGKRRKRHKRRSHCERPKMGELRQQPGLHGKPNKHARWNGLWCSRHSSSRELAGTRAPCGLHARLQCNLPSCPTALASMSLSRALQ